MSNSTNHIIPGNLTGLNNPNQMKSTQFLTAKESQIQDSKGKMHKFLNKNTSKARNSSVTKDQPSSQQSQEKQIPMKLISMAKIPMKKVNYTLSKNISPTGDADKPYIKHSCKDSALEGKVMKRVSDNFRNSQFKEINTSVKKDYDNFLMESKIQSNNQPNSESFYSRFRNAESNISNGRQNNVLSSTTNYANVSCNSINQNDLYKKQVVVHETSLFKKLKPNNKIALKINSRHPFASQAKDSKFQPCSKAVENLRLTNSVDEVHNEFHPNRVSSNPDKMLSKVGNSNKNLRHLVKKVNCDLELIKASSKNQDGRHSHNQNNSNLNSSTDTNHKYNLGFSKPSSQMTNKDLSKEYIDESNDFSKHIRAKNPGYRTDSLLKDKIDGKEINIYHNVQHNVNHQISINIGSDWENPTKKQLLQKIKNTNYRNSKDFTKDSDITKLISNLNQNSSLTPTRLPLNNSSGSRNDNGLNFSNKKISTTEINLEKPKESQQKDFKIFNQEKARHIFEKIKSINKNYNIFNDLDSSNTKNKDSKERESRQLSKKGTSISEDIYDSFLNSKEISKYRQEERNKSKSLSKKINESGSLISDESIFKCNKIKIAKHNSNSNKSILKYSSSSNNQSRDNSENRNTNKELTIYTISHDSNKIEGNAII